MRLRGYVNCATPWIGMAQDDQQTVVGLMTDISGFETVADRFQQGFLDFMYVGRALVHHDGFATDVAFRVSAARGPRPRPSGPPARRHLAVGVRRQLPGRHHRRRLMALSPDAQGAVRRPRDELLDPAQPQGRLRGVPLHGRPLYQAYPRPEDQQLMFGLIQQLWDRAEANGYAAHATTTPPEHPAHES